KYYYKTPYDYEKIAHPTLPNKFIWPNYNLIKKGILEKQEIYSENGTIKQSTEFNYTFPSYDLNEVYKYRVVSENNGMGDGGGIDEFYTQEQSAEKVKTDDYTYDQSGNSLKVTVERGFNLTNNNLMSEKKTSADGTITETAYKYAQEKNNTK